MILLEFCATEDLWSWIHQTRTTTTKYDALNRMCYHLATSWGHTVEPLQMDTIREKNVSFLRGVRLIELLPNPFFIFGKICWPHFFRKRVKLLRLFTTNFLSKVFSARLLYFQQLLINFLSNRNQCLTFSQTKLLLIEIFQWLRGNTELKF